MIYTFSEDDRQLIIVAMRMATEQWKKDRNAVPELGREFTRQIDRAGGIIAELES